MEEESGGTDAFGGSCRISVTSPFLSHYVTFLLLYRWCLVYPDLRKIHKHNVLFGKICCVVLKIHVGTADTGKLTL